MALLPSQVPTVDEIAFAESEFEIAAGFVTSADSAIAVDSGIGVAIVFADAESRQAMTATAVEIVFASVFAVQFVSENAVFASGSVFEFATVFEFAFESELQAQHADLSYDKFRFFRTPQA